MIIRIVIYIFLLIGIFISLIVIKEKDPKKRKKMIFFTLTFTATITLPGGYLILFGILGSEIMETGIPIVRILGIIGGLITLITVMPVYGYFNHFLKSTNKNKLILFASKYAIFTIVCILIGVGAIISVEKDSEVLFEVMFILSVITMLIFLYMVFWET